MQYLHKLMRDAKMKNIDAVNPAVFYDVMNKHKYKNYIYPI
jgi:hypothetical protein